VNTPPTVFHITHVKAGSQWVAEILKHSAPERFVQWKIDNKGVSEFSNNSIVPGNIYSTVYCPFDEFERIVGNKLLPLRSFSDFPFMPRRVLKNWLNFGFFHKPVVIFVLIRDLRDTLVSLYFSLKYSHSIIYEDMATNRKQLAELEEEEGLLYILTHGKVLANSSFQKIARIQNSWRARSDVLFLRYEDILGNEYSFFEKLVDYCQIDISRERLHDIVKYNIFENATGRKRGEENTAMHLRKGVAGDWRNHFTDRIKGEFKKRYGQTLIDTGYEKDLNW